MKLNSLKVLFAALLLFAATNSHATVSTEVRTVTTTGSGGSTFSFAFPYLSDSHIQVTKTTIADETEEVLVLNTDYTIARTGVTGGVVTTTSTVSSDYTITIARVMPLTQETAFKSHGGFYPRSHENAFDKLTMITQQIQDEVATSTESTAKIDAHIASSDDHTMYAKLTGRAGGQTLSGSTTTAQNLTLRPNAADLTTGKIYFNDASYFDAANDKWVMGDDLTCTGDTTVVDVVSSGDFTISGDVNIDGTYYGGDGASESLELISNSNGTLGNVYFNTADVYVDNSDNLIVNDLVCGGDGSGEDLTLTATKHATKGLIYFGEAETSCYDETNDRFGVGTTSPSYPLHVIGNGYFSGDVYAAGHDFYGGVNTSDSIYIKPSSAGTPTGNVYLYDGNNYMDNTGTLYLDGDIVIAGELQATGGTVSGGEGAGDNLYLQSTTSGTKGLIYLGATTSTAQSTGDIQVGHDLTVLNDVSVVGDATVVGTLSTGTLAPTNLAVTTDASVGDELTVTTSVTTADVIATDDISCTDDLTAGGDLAVSGLSYLPHIYGDPVAGNDLIISSNPSHDGVVYFGDAQDHRYNEDDETWYWGNYDASYGGMFNFYDNRGAGYNAVEIYADGNAASATALKISAGKDTIAVKDDVYWMTLADGDGDDWAYLSITGTTADFYASSDARLKKNIEDTDLHGLEVVNGLRIRQWDWDTPKREGHVDIGYIAQEAEEVFPDMVGTGLDGYKTVGDGALTPVLVKAVQELSAQVEALQFEINELHALTGECK